MARTRGNPEAVTGKKPPVEAVAVVVVVEGEELAAGVARTGNAEPATSMVVIVKEANRLIQTTAEVVLHQQPVATDLRDADVVAEAVVVTIITRNTGAPLKIMDALLKTTALLLNCFPAAIMFRLYHRALLRTLNNHIHLHHRLLRCPPMIVWNKLGRYNK